MWPTFGALLQTKAPQAKQNMSVLSSAHTRCFTGHHSNTLRPHILHYPAEAAKAPWKAVISLGVQATEQSTGGFKSCSHQG